MQILEQIPKLLQFLENEKVEYKPLGEVFHIKNGYTPSTRKKEYWENGTIPWFRMEDIRKNGRILKDSIQHITPQAVRGGKLFPANSILIATTATIGEHALAIVDCLGNQQFTFLTPKSELLDSINMKFMFYYGFILGEYCKENVNVSGFASVDMSKFKNFQIPLPPLEIQNTIVEILDNFTELITELNKALEKELELRKKQYEYYRNLLLSKEELEKRTRKLFCKDSLNTTDKEDSKNDKYKDIYNKNEEDIDDSQLVKMVKLGEIGTFTRGNGLTKADLKDFGIPAIHYGQIHTFYHNFTYTTKSFVSEEVAKKLKKGKKGDLIIVGVSENKEDVCKGIVYLGDDDVCISGDSFAFSHFQNPKFIGYALQTDIFNKYKERHAYGAKVTRLNIKALQNFQIPLPPLEIQNEIVEILDNFDALINDLNQGIPAEISLRRQQYEYYREKLLSFKEGNK